MRSMDERCISLAPVLGLIGILKKNSQAGRARKQVNIHPKSRSNSPCQGHFQSLTHSSQRYYKWGDRPCLACHFPRSGCATRKKKKTRQIQTRNMKEEKTHFNEVQRGTWISSPYSPVRAEGDVLLMKKVQNKSQESGRKDKLPVL